MNYKGVICGVFFAAFSVAQAKYVTISAGKPLKEARREAVNYKYQISSREVNLTEFAKAVKADARVGSGNENYWNDGVRMVGQKGPASMVSWYEAAKYCNWLTTGDAHKGAYTFDKEGRLTAVMTRKEILLSGSLFYVLPTESEWCKAAYYAGEGLGTDLWSLYANGTDVAPDAGKDGSNYDNVLKEPDSTWEIGGAQEQNGTYNMMGNVWEWLEGEPLLSKSGTFRGGAYCDNKEDISSDGRETGNYSEEFDYVGFRVVVVPEPATGSLIAVVGGIGFLIRRRFMD